MKLVKILATLALSASVLASSSAFVTPEVANAATNAVSFSASTSGGSLK